MAACACGGAKKEAEAAKPDFDNVKSWKADHSIIKEVMEEMKDDEIAKMKKVETKFGWTLKKACVCAVEREQHVGIYAGDAETYEKMAPVFNKVINKYHGITIEENKADEETYDAVKLPALSNAAAIKSTRIRTARNLISLPFTVNMTKEQRLKLEETMKKVFESFDGNLKGKYYPMDGMDKDVQKDLIDKHFLYIDDDETLRLVGCYDDWPKGRGIYINDEKHHGKGNPGIFIIWVGEEDQLRIMAMNKGSDVQAVWDLFYSGVEAVHKAVKKMDDDFMFSKTHGYLSSCPTNIGTGMRASVHVDLNGFKDKDEVKAYVKKKGMMIDIRGTRGEATKTAGSTFDVSNKARVGSSCVQQITTMVEGVADLMKESKTRES